MLTKEQIENRRNGLGGTDSVVLLGANKYATLQDLWADKMGLAQEIDPSPAMERGRHLEEVAASKYKTTTNRVLQKVNQTLVYKKDPLFFAHVDRKIISEKNFGIAPLEIKCPGLRVFAQIKSEGILPAYQIQAQHYMMVMNAKWASIAVFNAERWELIFVDIKRDEEIIEMIQQRGRSFWEQHILTGEAPQPEKVKADIDLPTIQIGSAELVRIESTEWQKAVDDLREVQALKEAVDQIEASAKSRIIELISQSGASAVETAGCRIYYQEHQGKKSFDLKAFRKANPELESKIAMYEKTGKPYKSLRSFFLKYPRNFLLE